MSDGKNKYGRTYAEVGEMMKQDQPGQAAREWWIGQRLMDAHPMSTWDENQEYVHVIEKRAYDELAQMYATLLQAYTTAVDSRAEMQHELESAKGRIKELEANGN